MKNEEFATARHFFAFLSHFIARLSQNYAEYPRFLAVSATIRTFASSNDKNEDGNRKNTITPLAE